MTDELPNPLGPRDIDPRDMRASHADRDAVVERLREAAGEGRLDLAELESRVERALVAKTYAELEPLTVDLPADPAPDPGRPLELRGGMNGLSKVGRWQVPARITAYGGMGGVRLDFTRVECRLPLVEVEVHGQMAGVKLVVPVGWEVDSDGVDPGLGGMRNKTSAEDRLPGTPLLRLTGSGGPAGVLVRHPNRWERRRLG